MYLTGSVKAYLKQLSSDKPVPGGGGTSALAGASAPIFAGLEVAMRGVSHVPRGR